MEDLTKEYENTIFARSLITNSEHEILKIALEYLLDNLDNMVGDFDTFPEENANLKQIANIKSLQKLFRL